MISDRGRESAAGFEKAATLQDCLTVQKRRSAADQRRLLAETIRATGRWRRSKADEFRGDEKARRQNARAALALLTLANFVETLPDDDTDLALPALRRTEERNGRLDLVKDGSVLLSRFGLNYGAWQSSSPSENQMRNLLRRIDGIEAQERSARKQAAEQSDGAT